jgi:hypothetical protein
MKMKSLLFVLFAVAMVIVAGCAAPEAEEPAPAPAPAPEPAAPEPTPVEPSVEFVSVPSEALIGKAATITWHVDGEGTASHTAVHWSTKSKANVEDLTVNTYSSMTPKGGVVDADLPGDFSGDIVLDAPIPVYLRAHAVIDGVDYWTEESVVNFVVKMTEEAPMEEESMEDEATQ